MVSPTHLSSRPLSRRCPLAAGGTRAANSLAGCGTGRPDAIFYMFTGEIFDYFHALLQRLRVEQPRYSFVHDVASNLSAGFARRNPPNAALRNDNPETSRFRERGGLHDAGVTPTYGTVADPWTPSQGLFDCTIGGMKDTRISSHHCISLRAALGDLRTHPRRSEVNCDPSLFVTRPRTPYAPTRAPPASALRDRPSPDPNGAIAETRI